jgi:hypothetical protein
MRDELSGDQAIRQSGKQGSGNTCTCCTLAPAASAGECRCQELVDWGKEFLIYDF